jgi:uncharacterized protein YfcZ (UPF0381/DUF406 family)
MTKIDFEKDRMQSVEQIDSAKRLSDKVLELKDLEDEIANAEHSLKKLKEKAKVVSSVEIPAMMDDMQITKLKLKDGESVEIKKIYGAYIPPEQQEAAFKWLRNNGLGDIIKNDITVTFGKGEDNKAAEYAVLAKGQGYEPVQKIGVHPQTLKAMVRERLEANQDVPSDLFKPFEGNQTKITRRN